MPLLSAWATSACPSKLTETTSLLEAFLGSMESQLLSLPVLLWGPLTNPTAAFLLTSMSSPFKSKVLKDRGHVSSVH